MYYNRTQLYATVSSKTFSEPFSELSTYMNSVWEHTTHMNYDNKPKSDYILLIKTVVHYKDCNINGDENVC